MSLNKFKENQWINKKSLRTRFIDPVVRLYMSEVHISDYYQKLLDVKALLLKNQKIIIRKYPEFLDEYQTSAIFDQVVFDLKFNKKELKKLVLKKSDSGNMLKKFYQFFDDKSLKLKKDVYLELKDVVQNDKIMSAKRITDIIPSVWPEIMPLIKWLNENYVN